MSAEEKSIDRWLTAPPCTNTNTIEGNWRLFTVFSDIDLRAASSGNSWIRDLRAGNSIGIEMVQCVAV